MSTFSVGVRVKLKDGILNPEAEAIKKALTKMKINSVKDLSIESRYVFKIDSDSESAALETARKMARDLLSNIVMENFEVELIP